MQRWGLVGSVPHLITAPDLYVLAVTMATGLVLFQTGLQRCSAAVVSPVNIVTSTAYVIAVGTVLFNEHLPTAALSLGLRVAGFAGVVVGLVTLAVAGGLGDTESEGADEARRTARTGRRRRSAQAQPVDVRISLHETSSSRRGGSQPLATTATSS